MPSQQSEPAAGLFIFCEGPHDVAFVRMVIEKCMGIPKAKDEQGETVRLDQYPAPLNQILKQSLVKHAAGELSHESAHRFFFPSHYLRSEAWHIFVFNTGGKDQDGPVKAFLKAVVNVPALIFPGGAKQHLAEKRFLFTFDADHHGVVEKLSEMSRVYARIEDKESSKWQLPPLIVGEGQRGAFAEDKGMYIWADPTGNGCLEDILMPLFEVHEDLHRKACAAMDDMHLWRVTQLKKSQARAERSKRQKAILTTMGQRKKPGASLNVIIDQGGLVSVADLKASPAVRDFMAFLNEFASGMK